jgi:hypothetical protein
MIFFHTSSALPPLTMLVAEIAPGIDERVHLRRTRCQHRAHAFDSDDRIEARAGCVDADPLLDRVQSLLLNDLRHREHFRDRLDRHFSLHVAGGDDLAVNGHQCDTEQVRIDLGQRGNVVGVLAFLQVPELLVRSLDRFLRIARLRESAARDADEQRDDGHRATHVYSSP